MSYKTDATGSSICSHAFTAAEAGDAAPVDAATAIAPDTSPAVESFKNPSLDSEVSSTAIRVGWREAVRACALEAAQEGEADGFRKRCCACGKNALTRVAARRTHADETIIAAIDAATLVAAAARAAAAAATATLCAGATPGEMVSASSDAARTRCLVLSDRLELV